MGGAWTNFCQPCQVVIGQDSCARRPSPSALPRSTITWPAVSGDEAPDNFQRPAAMGPLTAGIESLKGLGSKLGKGEAGDTDISSFQNVIDGVMEAGKSAGAEVTDKVPRVSQLGG